MSCRLWNVHGNAMFFMKCSVYAMSCFWNVLFMKWNAMSMQFPVYEMSCLCNILLFMKCQWQCNVFYEMFCLCNVLFMKWNAMYIKCPEYEIFCKCKEFGAKRIEYILEWNLLEKSVKRQFCCPVSILQVYFTYLCYITF